MRDHKSLLAWQQAHAVVLDVRRLCRKHWRPDAAVVLEQLARASLSAQLNIAEGHALRATRRFRNHLVIAYGSAVETIELLELLDKEKTFPDELVQPALKAGIRTRMLLLGLLRRYRNDGKA